MACTAWTQSPWTRMAGHRCAREMDTVPGDVPLPARRLGDSRDLSAQVQTDSLPDASSQHEKGRRSERVTSEIPGLKTGNNTEGGKTPILSLERAHELGFMSVCYVLTGLYAAALD